MRATSLRSAAPASGVRLVALPTALDDAAVVEGVREGHAPAARILFERHGAHVQRVLTRLLGADPEIGDLVHDVFVEALSGIDKLNDPSALRGWLTGIAVFSARQCIRRRSRRRWLRFVAPWEVPEVEAPAHDGESSEALRSTYAVLAGLPTDERIAFALRYIDGMALDDVAEACGVSLATVKRRLSRAETKFVAAAREHPALGDYLDGRPRWGAR